MSTFYDIHMHAFNLSHPYFLAFVNRFKPKLAPLLISFGVASLLSAIRLKDTAQGTIRIN